MLLFFKKQVKKALIYKKKILIAMRPLEGEFALFLFLLGLRSKNKTMGEVDIDDRIGAALFEALAD